MGENAEFFFDIIVETMCINLRGHVGVQLSLCGFTVHVVR